MKNILAAMDDKGRWFTKQVYISNPHIGDGTKTELTEKYMSTNVGDETDTSPYPDESDQDYISTRTFINNMQVILNYVSSGDKNNN